MNANTYEFKKIKTFHGVDKPQPKNQNPPPFAALEGRLRHGDAEKIKTSFAADFR